MKYRDLERVCDFARKSFPKSKVDLLEEHFHYIPASEVVGFYLLLDYSTETAFDILAPGSMEDNVESMGGFEEVVLKINRGYAESNPGLWFEVDNAIFSLTDETFVEQFVNLRDLAYRMVLHYNKYQEKTYSDAVDEILESNNPSFPLV